MNSKDLNSMMNADGPAEDLARARRRIAEVDGDLSALLQLFHGLLLVVVTSGSADVGQRIRSRLRSKILELPQGCSIGMRLIDLDREFGSPLESLGVSLERWVFQSRGRSK